MPRAYTSTRSTERTRVKEEKGFIKDERNKRRTHVEEEEEEQSHEPQEQDEQEKEGEGEEDHDEEQSGSPRGTKRTRINGEGDSVPGPSNSQPSLPRVKTQPRDVDNYIPGSIVRIQLYNFVTYDYVQFRPGPYLNMIIGPNGTGKSSIACAIALGLNFPPAILGRANEINSYVKNGADTGYIEIELKGPKNKDNLIIRRNLNASSKSSTYTLNGQPASGKEINTKMAELNVQVGNLCSFLPQDRVSEFAAMSSQQLLKETQRAAGDENLTNWHNTLITAGQELKAIQQTIKDDEDSLKQMQERNEGIERDVQRFKERKRIEHIIALLDVLIPVAEYREIRLLYLHLKAEQRRLKIKAQRLQDKNKPAHDLLKKYQHDAHQAETEREELKKSTVAKFKKLNSKHKGNDELDAEGIEIQDQIASLRKEEKTRLQAIKSLDHNIEKIKLELEKPPTLNLPTEDELRALAEEIKLERPALINRKNELNDEMQSIIDKRVQYQTTIASAEQSIKQQYDSDNQKLNKMRAWDPDTADAILWVRAHPHLFRMEVFETPFMRLTMKDKKFTNAVEACFGNTQMKSFIAQCQEDCDTINKYINDEQGLGRKARVTTWFRPHQPHLLVPPPMSEDELKQLGFDGYAIDYVDFPEGMRWFLTRDINLHRTAIALNAAAVNVNQAMQCAARPFEHHSGGANFICGPTMNIVSRSRYGKKAIGNMTRDVQPAKNLSAPTTDHEAIRKQQERINEAQQAIGLCDEAQVPVKASLDELENQEKDHKAKLEKFQRLRDMKKKEATRVTGLKSKLESMEKNIAAQRAKPTAEKQSIKLRENLRVNVKKRQQIIREYTDLLHAIIPDQITCTNSGLQFLQICANRGSLTELCQRKDAKYQEALVELHKVTADFKEAKENSLRILDHSREALDNAAEEVQAEYKQMEYTRSAWETACKEAGEKGVAPPPPGDIDMRSLDELQAELDTQRANLEMNINTNPGVVEQYEKRKKDIEQLEKTLEGRRKKEEKVARDIKNARDNWQPALQRLVDSIGVKFSAAFDRIGCAGEIRISEDEDYDKWAIDILVKFRDSEKLQLLTVHRQSGGERSLTTILYLMSLTEEARAPFSLVDEINQGMDQRAERMVHNSMVGVTCKEESGQYFLITPKLLPDLDYDEKMKILVVNNGEWLPEERDIGSMNDMINVFLHSKKANGMGSL